MDVSRETVLQEVRSLLSRSRFSHEDGARASALLKMAEVLGPTGRIQDAKVNLQQLALCDSILRGATLTPGQEIRTVTEAGEEQTVATSVLVQQGFYDQLMVALKAFDPLCDENVVTIATSKAGTGYALPGLDDTAGGAVIVNENALDQTEVDPPLQGATLGTAPIYRTSTVQVSIETVQDSGFPIADVLAAAFAIRLSRKAGADLVTSLLGSALLGATAQGSSKNTGGTETGGTTVGYGDLIALRKSVNPAYRKSPKCAWLLNDNSLADIDSILDKNGRPVIHPEYDAAGNRLLLGFPVRIAPSMPDIGLSAKPIAFGDLSRWVTRIHKDSYHVKVFQERFILYGNYGYNARLRCNGALMNVSATDSPIKYLQNAAS